MHKITARGFVLTSIFIMIFLQGCSVKNVRPQSLSPDHVDLSHLQDDLAILVVRLPGDYHTLNHLTVKNLETQQVYPLPFFDNPILGSSYLEFEKIGTGKDIIQHIVFLDIPVGKYQIQRIQVFNIWKYGAKYTVNDIGFLFFEYGPGSPAYLGELYITLGDEIKRTGVFTKAKDAYFSTSTNFSENVNSIQTRYKALKTTKIHQGKIWKQ